MGGGRGAGGRVGGVGIGGYSGARTSPPFLPNIIVIAGRVAAFPRTRSYDYYRSGARWPRNAATVTLQFRWRISRRDGSMVTFSTIFVDGPLKYLEGFHRFSRDDTWLCLSQRGLGVYLGRRCRWYLKWNIVERSKTFIYRCVHLCGNAVIVSIKSNHLPFYLAIRIFTSRKNFCWFTFKARRSIADRSKFMQVIWLFLDKMNNLSKTIQKYKKKKYLPLFFSFRAYFAAVICRGDGGGVGGVR